MISPAAKQTRFQLPIADDVRLVSVETARAARGVTAESIFEMVEDGQLLAFDLSAHLQTISGARRELRVWARCLRTENFSREIDGVIADCLLTNTQGLPNVNFNLNASQLERAWCVSNQTVLKLIEHKLLAGVRVGRNWKVNRASAAAFLKGRAL